MQAKTSHALDVLEFAAALEVVASFAASELGADSLVSRELSTEPERVKKELGLVAEGMSLLGQEKGWAMPDIPDLHEPLQRLRLEGYGWDGPTLRAGARLLSASRATRSLLRPLHEQVPGLAAIAEFLADLPQLIEKVEKAIGEDGEVRDTASPDLAKLRREIQGARGRIVQRLTEYAAGLPSQHQVADASVTIRDGRYVVPVRREGRSEVGGIIHGESQTGSTLFVEPPIAIELMNRLRELEAAESREVARILRELTESLRPHADDLAESLDALVRLDTIYARGRYALKVDGHPPEVFAAGEETLQIVQGKHPLLLATGEAVVPFDLRMEGDERTLVISGPNTGGKTVLLKAVGLISLLVQAGVVPPVDRGSRLALFSGVFADIGDEQSIEASLSTFSAHLKNLRETLAGADGGSLVLIDEIGSGTDPVEGAALAQAILQELTERSAFTIATTHLGSLKLLAAEDPRIVNASLQFDAEKLQPTYRLLKGVPGRSYGLAIAKRLGLPEEVLQRAEAAMPEGERDVGKLLLELEAKEQRVTSLEAELAARLSENTRLHQELEQRELDLVRREKDSERRARQQARDLLMQSRSEVEAAIDAVRGAADEAALDHAATDARRRVEEAARRQRERTPEAPKTRKSVRSREELRVGARVRIESLNRTGTLLEIRDSKGVVDTAGLRMQLALEDLTMLPEGDQKPEARRATSQSAGGKFQADLDASPEVDLRGLRVDELGFRLNQALDKAIVAGLPSFRIIHGKGTGALRAEVHDLLSSDPRITTFRPGERFEGGTGVTVVEFG